MMSPLNDSEAEINEVAEQEALDRYKKMMADGVIAKVPIEERYPGECRGLGDLGQPTFGVNPKDLVGATKPPLSLVPPCFHVYVAMAMKNGAKKYGPYNWRQEKVQSMIYLDAAMRHIQSFVDGETNAKDSGQHHLAHAAACMAILLDAFLNDCVIDNRPVAGRTAELIEQLTEKK